MAINILKQNAYIQQHFNNILQHNDLICKTKVKGEKEERG